MTPTPPAKRSRNLVQTLRQAVAHVQLSLRLLRDSRVPRRLKAYCVAALLYLISPIDLIPDWVVPLFGGLDDIGLVWLAFRTSRTKAPEQVVREHAHAVGLERPNPGAEGPHP